MHLALDIQAFENRLTDQVGIPCGRSQLGHGSDAGQCFWDISLGAVAIANQESGDAFTARNSLAQRLLIDVIESDAVTRQGCFNGIKTTHVASPHKADFLYIFNRHEDSRHNGDH